MLNKLEALYLNILRVVIIVLATVMLVGAGIAVVVAGPMLLSSFKGEASAGKLVRGDTLAAYQRGETNAAGATDGADLAEVEQRAADADPRFRQAAENISRYVGAKMGTTVVQPAVAGYLQDLAYRLPESLNDRYADSVVALTADLAGAPASAGPVDVDNLINWHFTQFQQAAEEAAQRNEAQAVEAAAQRSTAILAATFAIVLFAIFLLMVFVFVLVKIERNLRTVPVLIGAGSEGVTLLAKRAVGETGDVSRPDAP